MQSKNHLQIPVYRHTSKNLTSIFSQSLLEDQPSAPSIKSFKQQESESDLSDSSIDVNGTVMKDCAPIFDEHFNDSHLDEIKQRLESPVEEDYASYQQKFFLWSCQVLKRGIPAVKLNFSNCKTKNVTIRLVDRRQALEYFTDEPEQGNLCSMMFGAGTRRRIPLSDFHGIIYGGSTATFDYHKKQF